MLEPDDTAEDDTLARSLQPSPSAEGPAPVYLIDPQALPADAEVRPAPVSTSTQTELHLDQGDVVVVIPCSGGYLQPIQR